MPSADTWALFDGEALAISGSANEYTNLPDGRDVISGAFDDDARSSLETCATDAILGLSNSGG